MNPILALIIANIIWGAASPLFKFALTDIPPFTLAFLRFFLASFLFIPFIWKYKWEKIATKDWLTMLLAGFFGITINISFFFLGLEKGTSINAPVIASAGPVFGFLAAIFFLREKPKFKVLTGMLISFLGVLIIIFAPIIFFSGVKTQNFGGLQSNLFFVLATMGAITEALLLKRVFARIKPQIVVCLNFFFLSLTFLPFSLMEMQTWSFSELHIPGWIGIVFGVLFSSALAYYLYYYGISKITIQEVNLFTYVDPVVAILIAAPLLREFPDLYFALGSVLVFSGIFIAEGRLHYHPFHKLRVAPKILASELQNGKI